MTARALNMSSALYHDLFQLDDAIRRNQEAGELGAAAGLGNAVLQSGIDDLARPSPGTGSSRIQRAQLWR